MSHRSDLISKNLIPKTRHLQAQNNLNHNDNITFSIATGSQFNTHVYEEQLKIQYFYLFLLSTIFF